MNSRLEGFLGLAILGGLVGGGILGWLGWQQRLIFEQGSATPQQIRLADLAAKGPGKNIHLTVTDFFPGDPPVVEKKGAKWNRVWIPLFPTGGPRNNTGIKVVVKTFHINNEAELDRFYQRKTITGVITNSIHNLGSREVAELKKGYPGANFDDAWMIEEGRDFPSEGTVGLMLGIAGVLLVVGVAAAVVLVIVKRRARSA